MGANPWNGVDPSNPNPDRGDRTVRDGMHANAVVLMGEALTLAQPPSGWAVMGNGPGTSVGAVAEGRWHAVRVPRYVGRNKTTNHDTLNKAGLFIIPAIVVPEETALGPPVHDYRACSGFTKNTYSEVRGGS